MLGRWWLIVVVALGHPAAATAQDLMVINARIITGTGKVIERGSIRIHDGTIVSVSAGGERAAAVYILIETAKLNGVDPEAWLRDALTEVGEGLPTECQS